MQKGIIFTLSIFLLLMSFVLLLESNTKTSQKQNETAAILRTYQKLSDAFNNLHANIIDLGIKGSFKETKERILPFKFETDQNTISLQFGLPVREGTLARYFDTANAFEIFAEDKNYSNYYTGKNVAVEAAKNTGWGGGQTSLNFVVEPSCMNISAQQTGMVFGKSWCKDFDLSDTTRIDTNIIISTPNEDLNSISCFWNGTESCPNDPYNNTDPRPYFQLEIFDENCSLCAFSNTTASGHFDSSQNNWIAVHCTGTECISKQIDLNLAGEFLATRSTSGLPSTALAAITLKERIRKFYFNDLNISVSADDFNFRMRTQR
ncbi:MAG: hypothetical protein HYW50_01675 [Candidatus Diapherotrites archaeon]|nr:hypothetical protein [Candidatus Diapherotrites archaeon]